MLRLDFYVISLATIVSIFGCVWLKPTHRWVALLLGSILFFELLLGWQLIVLLVFSLWIYFGARFIEYFRTKKISVKKFNVVLIVIALVPLIISKLLPLLANDNKCVDDASLLENPLAFLGTIELLCISYYTFNGISYLIDVRKGYFSAERNYGIVLLYLVFYPIVLSGPLERAKQLIPQLKTSIQLSFKNFSEAFRIILWGVFKNFVLGQHFLIYHSKIKLSDPQGFFILLQGLTFYFYLYFTFSSYIDILGGIARIFNIKLQSNFGNRVYAASSRKKFWENWHVTLNHWFRDYFFFAIAKRIRSKWLYHLALLATFVLIGLWHSISFSYLVWGLLNGVWMILENRYASKFVFIEARIRRFLGQLYHLFFASFLAIIFSSEQPVNDYKSLFLKTNINPNSINWFIKYALIILFLFIPFDWFCRTIKDKNLSEFIGEFSIYKRWTFYFLLILVISLFTNNWDVNNYYFRF